MRIEKVAWKELRTIMDNLTKDNKYLTPYQTFEFLDKIKNGANLHRFREAKKYKLHCYVVYKEEKAVFVAPLLVNDNERRLYLLGEFSSVGHLDFIYNSHLSTKDFSNILQLVFSNYNGYVFCCDRISQFSLTYLFLKEKNITPTEKEICVKIDVNNYDEWHKALSKSCRQNLRTSYNRMNTDGVGLTFNMYVNSAPPQKAISDNIKLFSKRILEHTKLSKVLLLPMIVFKKTETFGKALYSSHNNIFASVYINNKLAASLNGLIANDGRAIITRLSIETKLGKYSPGGLLINETIKEICDKYSFIKSIDLSRGDEPYKYTYGGMEHYNYSYQIKVSNLLLRF